MAKKSTAKKGKRMRTAFIRVSAVNHTESGEVVEYTFDDIKDTIDKWLKTKKFNYYIIQYSNEDGSNCHFHMVLEFKDKSTCEFNTL